MIRHTADKSETIKSVFDKAKLKKAKMKWEQEDRGSCENLSDRLERHTIQGALNESRCPPTGQPRLQEAL